MKLSGVSVGSGDTEAEIFEYFIFSLYFCFILFLSYILFYNQVYNNFPSDLSGHIRFTAEVSDGVSHIPHRLFQYIVIGVSNLFGINFPRSAIIVNALSVVFLVITFYVIAEKNFKKYKYEIKLLVVVLATFSGTFYLPELGLTSNHYLGNGSISIWHNPTLALLKPIALISIYLFCNACLYEKLRIQKLVVSCIFAIVSIMAKPSFIVVFLPAILSVALLMQFVPKFLNHLSVSNKYVWIYAGFLFLFSIFILSIQFNIAFNGADGGGMVVAPLKVWHLYSKNIAISIIIGNLYLINVYFIKYSRLSFASLISLCMLVEGAVLFAMFSETGERSSSGNFSWSYVLMQNLAFFFILIDFIKNFQLMSKTGKWCGSLIFSMHFCGGLYYFIKIFNGGSFV